MFETLSNLLTPKVFRTEESPTSSELCDQLCELCEADFEIYIDTCSLLDSSGLRFLEAAQKTIPKYKKHLNIFVSVLTEVERVGKKDLTKKRMANIIIEKLRQLETEGMIRIIIGRNNHFSDVNFISEFVLLSSEKNVLLITQDKALAEKINGLTDYLGEVVKNKYLCRAQKLGTDGMLENFVPHTQNNSIYNTKEENLDGCKIYFKPLYEFKG